MQWLASDLEGNRQSKKYYINCYLRSTYAIEAGSEVRTDLGPRRRRGRGKIRTKFTLRPPNGCGRHAPNRGIFLFNICADIPGASVTTVFHVETTQECFPRNRDLVGGTGFCGINPDYE